MTYSLQVIQAMAGEWHSRVEILKDRTEPIRTKSESPEFQMIVSCWTIADFVRVVPINLAMDWMKSMAISKLSEYVKTAEAADILGVAQNTLRAWAEEGKIPMYRNPANGYRLFQRSDLESFLRQAAQPVKPLRVTRRSA